MAADPTAKTEPTPTEAELAKAIKWRKEIPWESLWKYCVGGDYDPEDWYEVKDWIEENMPASLKAELT